MQPEDYYIQHLECLKTGVAIREARVSYRDYSLYECAKFGGECRQMKCVDAHNHSMK